jgi:Raf kinase inhibitor-like YbhB/YbcL family protein
MVVSRESTRLFAAMASLCVTLPFCTGTSAAAENSGNRTMQLSSTAFAEGESIPAKYTCDGENVSPRLNWTGAPGATKSLVLIADDPDAPMGTWVHWVLYDVPASATELPEALPKSQYLPGGSKQGLNDFKHLGYGGPCPPPGKPHRYFFKLYALDRTLDLKPGATKKEVERAMEKHTLAQGQLMGTYKRK